MIISGGFNVYPSEVEQVIWSHPAVQDCAVIGVPDDKWGEAVKAVVELNAGHTRDRRGADRAVQGEARQRQGAEDRRFHRRAAAQRGGQGAEEGPAPELLGRPGAQDLTPRVPSGASA